MNVLVKFFTSLREITGNKEEKLQFSSTITIKELLTWLSQKHGQEFNNYIYDKRGNVQTYIQILVNGRGIEALGGFETKLNDGDTVAIFPPVGGG